ncbi:MAG: peroxiredoxin-like family protein [Saprospiraceae bacterium]|nr:peroxiredoxin-like family protein [Saprospiraceae bacterium]
MKTYVFYFILSIVFLQMNNGMTQSTLYKNVSQAKGLLVGDKVQDFSAMDVYGQRYSLQVALRKGPVVLLFIRGQWCPVCNRHLSGVQDSLPMIYEKGASVVVVSPEKSEFLMRTVEKTGAEFTILYDEGYTISDGFDVTFLPDSLTRIMYNTLLGAKLKESHSDDSERLPIPATFIIGQDGVIRWRHFDPDYKRRASVTDIVRNL